MIACTGDAHHAGSMEADELEIRNLVAALANQGEVEECPVVRSRETLLGTPFSVEGFGLPSGPRTTAKALVSGPV